jgi:hypothetical protein
MYVIRHEHVRGYFELVLPCRSQDLRVDQVDGLRVGEVIHSIVCAEAQRVQVLADVTEVGEVRRVGVRHAAEKGSIRASPASA